ncbi:MAG TPA: DUF2934 domain-containing protein [Thermodesulfovibrionales bacterium]|nr:DUF2934 domain-containing protein [Thermodesulfovibrionales bacterium]
MNTLRDEIAKVAFELYEKRGRGGGSHLDDWLEAEKIVMARHSVVAEGEGKPLKTKKRKTSARALKEKETETAAKVSPRKKTTAKKAPAKKTV